MFICISLLYVLLKTLFVAFHYSVSHSFSQTINHIVSVNISFNCGMTFPEATRKLLTNLALINFDILPNINLSCTSLRRFRFVFCSFEFYFILTHSTFYNYFPSELVILFAQTRRLVLLYSPSLFLTSSSHIYIVSTTSIK
jgi:hypothetical protein